MHTKSITVAYPCRLLYQAIGRGFPLITVARNASKAGECLISHCLRLRVFATGDSDIDSPAVLKAAACPVSLSPPCVARRRCVTAAGCFAPCLSGRLTLSGSVVSKQD